MKKVNTAALNQSRNFSQQKLTIGLDLGDRCSWHCVLDENGELQWEQKLSHHSQGHARGVQPNGA
jgi:Ethanolamine utilization protein EutJ (predicted chaperonin)